MQTKPWLASPLSSEGATQKTGGHTEPIGGGLCCHRTDRRQNSCHTPRTLSPPTGKTIRMGRPGGHHQPSPWFCPVLVP